MLHSLICVIVVLYVIYSFKLNTILTSTLSCGIRMVIYINEFCILCKRRRKYFKLFNLITQQQYRVYYRYNQNFFHFNDGNI